MTAVEAAHKTTHPVRAKSIALRTLLALIAIGGMVLAALVFFLGTAYTGALPFIAALALSGVGLVGLAAVERSTPYLMVVTVLLATPMLLWNWYFGFVFFAALENWTTPTWAEWTRLSRTFIALSAGFVPVLGAVLALILRRRRTRVRVLVVAGFMLVALLLGVPGLFA